MNRWLIIMKYQGVEHYFPSNGSIQDPKWSVDLDKAARFKTLKDARFFFRPVLRQYINAPGVSVVCERRRLEP